MLNIKFKLSGININLLIALVLHYWILRTLIVPDARCNRAIGTLSEIMIIINNVSQGYFYFSIGLIMRESILISKLMLNSEVWVNLTKQQINQLEQADLGFQRKLLNCHSKTNIEIIYSELGTIPLHISLKKRRLMYLWHILNRKESELIFRVYSAQKFQTSKSDWINLINQDKDYFGLNFSDQEFRSFSKDSLKKLLSEKVRIKRKEYLYSLQSKKSKSKFLLLKDHPEQYFSDSRLTREQVQTLFSLRSRTYNCKDNFRIQYSSNLLCDLCELALCQQSHILCCPKILKNITIDQQILLEINHDMIYGNTDQQVQFMKTFDKFASVRNSLLKIKQQHS